MTTVTDPNAAFDAERREQLDSARDRQAEFAAKVADGRLVKIGNDRYRVNDPGSWDNGEVLTARSGEIMPEHGLDMSLGTAALYSRVPAWHELGNIVPEGVSDIDEVLRLGGIDFEVDKRPIQFTDINGRSQVMPDLYVASRSDTGAGLGVVGKIYTHVQNRAAYTFLTDLVDKYGVLVESAGALREGRRVFVTLRLPDTVTIDAGGIHDEIIPFIAALNSHDGSSKFDVVVTPWRPLCGNTERFAVRDAITKWGVRHTTNALNRIEEARRTLRLSVEYFEAFAVEENLLAQTDVELAEFEKVMNDLWKPPADDAPKQSVTKYNDQRDKLVARWESNAAQLGNTAYAAERAITEFLDWDKRIAPRGALRGNNLAARATLALEGADDPVKTKAHKRLLTLTNR